MPSTAKDLASWAKRAREATARRDELIRQMRADGASLRAIAEVAGLSHMAISKIVNRGRS
jgi:DNA invertase Pin-like site-specific DNA recombinase